MTSTELMGKIVHLLDAKKAQDIEVLDIRELTTMADYFVICTGSSTTQIKALSDELDEKLSREDGIRPLGKEGFSTAYWILMDYDSVIVHIFSGETREFYSIEHLWSDAKRTDITGYLVKPQDNLERTEWEQ